MRKKAAYELAVARVTRALHEEGHIPRAALAHALDVPEAELTRMELGAEAMSAGALVLLLDYCKLGWEDFLKRVEGELPAAEKQIR